MVHDSFYVADPLLLEEYGFGELDRKSSVLNLILNNLQELSRKFELVVVEPLPEAGWNVPMLLSKQAMLEWGGEYNSLPLSLYLERTESFRSIFILMTVPYTLWRLVIFFASRLLVYLSFPGMAINFTRMMIIPLKLSVGKLRKSFCSQLKIS